METLTVILALLWLASTLYTVFVSSPYKRDDNADFGEMDIETIRQLLKDKLEYPYCKSILTNEEGNLDLKCKYATYSVKIEDRKLVIKDKFRPFSKESNLVEEKDCLEAYLVKILLPEAEINPPKAFAHFQRYIKLRILKKISGWLCIVFLVLLALGEKGIGITDIANAWKSKGVSQMCFTDYSDEITIGEALKATCTQGKWSSNKIRDNLYHVTFSGYGANGSLLTILFQKDGNSCSIKSITVGDDDVTLMQGLFLEMIYENAPSDDTRGQEVELLETRNMESGDSTRQTVSALEEVETVETEVESEMESIPAYDYENIVDEDIVSGDWYDDEQSLDNESYGYLENLLDEVMASRASYGRAFQWDEGENEDSDGADVTILIEEDMDVMMLTGNCWHGAQEDEYLGLCIGDNDDGSIIFEDENGGRLIVYMQEDESIYIEDFRASSGATFTGTYDSQ
ncbi:MAG: hypothetical protein HDR05_05420 [Lachnospiraceae bacterium]|nr:hypothetical protein [Lachnospiraceae bacterium]